MTDARSEIVEAIRSRCVRRGSFSLASGASSTVYVDVKRLLLDPCELGNVSELVYGLVDPTSEAIGGMAMGSVPLVIGVAAHAWNAHRRRLGCFFVRSDRKQHGTTSVLESSIDLSGKRATVLEDVTTSGGSALEAIAHARSAGASAFQVVTVLDRQSGADETMRIKGVKLCSLIRLDEVL